MNFEKTIEEHIFEKVNEAKSSCTPDDKDIIIITLSYAEFLTLFYLTANNKNHVLFGDEFYYVFFDKLKDIADTIEGGSDVELSLVYWEIMYVLFLITDIVIVQQRVRNAHKAIRSEEFEKAMKYLDGMYGDCGRVQRSVCLVKEYIECLEEEVKYLHSLEGDR